MRARCNSSRRADAGSATDIGNQSDGQSAGRVDEADGDADVERRAEVDADVAVEAPAR